ncbi:hypothetical protein C7S15_5561 [Burkholderia cepacia]|nr:hypothetical protein [Burkholderia cepacia]
MNPGGCRRTTIFEEARFPVFGAARPKGQRDAMKAEAMNGRTAADTIGRHVTT